MRLMKYEVCLNWYDKKKNKDKVALLKEEMKRAFGINVGNIKWGLDNRQFTLDKENKCIHPSLTSLKSMGKNVAEELYLISQNLEFETFYGLLQFLFPKGDIGMVEIYKRVGLASKVTLNSKMLDILVRIDYFSEFGKGRKLLKFIEYYNLLEGKKAPKKSTLSKTIDDSNILDIIAKNSIPTEVTYTKFNCNKALKEIWDYLPNIDFTTQEKIIFEKEIFGYVDYRNGSLDKRFVLINSSPDTKYTPKIDTYCLNNGNTCKCKVSKKLYNNKSFKENDIIYIHSMTRKYGYKKVGETMDKKGNIKPIFEEDTSKIEWWINDYSIIEDLEEAIDLYS